jgi:hypothetical protein
MIYMFNRYWYNSKINDLTVEFVLSLWMNIVNNGMWYSLFFLTVWIFFGICFILSWQIQIFKVTCFHLILFFSLSLLIICAICGLSLIKFFPRTDTSYYLKQEKKEKPCYLSFCIFTTIFSSFFQLSLILLFLSTTMMAMKSKKKIKWTQNSVIQYRVLVIV